MTEQEDMEERGFNAPRSNAGSQYDLVSGCIFALILIAAGAIASLAVLS